MTLITRLMRIICIFVLLSVGVSSFASHPAVVKQKVKAKHLHPFVKYPKINYGTGHQAQVLKRGEYLARVGDCLACHTNIQGEAKPFAGGLPINTPFGRFFSPNITPDKTTGIGNWTYKDFKRAMRHGTDPRGRNYFPVFPYLYYTKIADQDLQALWVYFKAIPAVKRQNEGNELPFPLNWRFAQYGWKALFFYPHKGIYDYDADKSPEWNRGKYLVEGLGHCGMCHTPLNFFGAPKRKYYMTGSFIEGFWAPNITSKGLASATKEEVVNVFKKGELINKAGKVTGPMAAVLHDSLSYLTEKDLYAIATYLKNVESPADPFYVNGSDEPPTLARGKKVYRKVCHTCHQAGLAGAPRIGDAPNWMLRAAKGYQELYRNVIHGYASMPPRGACVSCSDQDIEAAVDYIVYASLSKTQLEQLKHGKPKAKVKLTLNDGKRIYNQVCSTCHKDGKLGAPILGDKEAWKPLIAKNMDVLITNTLHGGQKMPVKGGCKHCSTGELIAAVKYMVEQGKTSGDYTLW